MPRAVGRGRVSGADDFDAERGRSARENTLTAAESGSTSPSTPSTPLAAPPPTAACRSEEHTSELQSLRHLVCRLLLEKKNRSILESTYDRVAWTELEPAAHLLTR